MTKKITYYVPDEPAYNAFLTKIYEGTDSKGRGVLMSVVSCPYCHNRHIHGTSYEGETPFRIPHCHPKKRPGRALDYRIEFPEEYQKRTGNKVKGHTLYERWVK